MTSHCAWSSAIMAFSARMLPWLQASSYSRLAAATSGKDSASEQDVVASLAPAGAVAWRRWARWRRGCVASSNGAARHAREYGAGRRLLYMAAKFTRHRPRQSLSEGSEQKADEPPVVRFFLHTRHFEGLSRIGTAAYETVEPVTFHCSGSQRLLGRIGAGAVAVCFSIRRTKFSLRRVLFCL